jgi:hypothetical protein
VPGHALFRNASCRATDRLNFNCGITLAVTVSNTKDSLGFGGKPIHGLVFITGAIPAARKIRRL